MMRTRSSILRCSKELSNKIRSIAALPKFRIWSTYLYIYMYIHIHIFRYFLCNICRHHWPHSTVTFCHWSLAQGFTRCQGCQWGFRHGFSKRVWAKEAPFGNEKLLARWTFFCQSNGMVQYILLLKYDHKDQWTNGCKTTCCTKNVFGIIYTQGQCFNIEWRQWITCFSGLRHWDILRPPHNLHISETEIKLRHSQQNGNFHFSLSFVEQVTQRDVGG